MVDILEPSQGWISPRVIRIDWISHQDAIELAEWFTTRGYSIPERLQLYVLSIEEGEADTSNQMCILASSDEEALKRADADREEWYKGAWKVAERHAARSMIYFFTRASLNPSEGFKTYVMSSTPLFRFGQVGDLWKGDDEIVIAEHLINMKSKSNCSKRPLYTISDLYENGIV